MRFNIIKNGEVINTIIADCSFAEDYCAENGYTYEAIPYAGQLKIALEDRIALLEETKADRSDVDAITAAIEKGLSL